MNYKKIITAFALTLLAAAPAGARSSKVTRAGVGPMYWMAYEQCFVTDQALSEGRYKENVEWVKENFLPYGYDMICTDGWIEGAQTVNKNGFITKYNSGWEMTLADMVEYCRERGMKAGIYYNPLWMSAAAYNTNARIVDSEKRTQDIAGDKDFNGLIKWVDTDKEGAEQWVKGYVNYFKSLGFTFLRMDFVNWYENAYGRDRYEKALKWVAEACGEDMTFSLVMPNCYDNSAVEIPYCDIMRISEDVFGGGFDFVSGRRKGQYQEGWANWGNISDGFAAFSNVCGRGRCVMDGDFIRLNTCETDEERRYWVSLIFLTGSPVAIADQYDTGAEFIDFYRNEDLIALHKAGFNARPLSADPTDPDSSIWVGQMPDGSWVAGLFNRGDSAETMTLRLSNDLGVAPEDVASVRDLWSHTDRAIDGTTISETVPAHGCKVLRLTMKTKRYQAEVAGVTGSARIVK